MTSPTEYAIAPRTALGRPRIQRLSAGHLATLFGLFAFAGSLLLSPYYISGDQEAYKPLYEEILDYKDWESKFTFYFLTVGAIEPFYLLLVNLLAGALPKDLAFSILNGVLAGCVALWLLQRRVSALIVAPLMLNAYLIVLFFSAERLKVALLLFTLGFILHKRWRWLLFLLAVLTQFQTLLLVLVHLIWQLGAKPSRKRALQLTLLLLVLAGAVVALSGNPLLAGYLTGKLDFYADSGWGGLGAIAKPLLYMAAALYYSPQRRRVLASFLPLVVATYFLGSERLALFSYFLFMIIVAPYRHGWNLATLLATAYYSYQGVAFIANFIDHGHGLPEGD